MKLNESKTTVAKFGTRQQLSKLHKPSLMIADNVTVDILSEVRSLGLFYDKNMSFNLHFEKLAKCCSVLLYNIRSIRPYIEQDVALLLVDCFVISRMRMFSEITGTATKTNLEMMQKIINNAVRVVYNLRKFDHISSFCDRVPWGKIRMFSDDSFNKIVNAALSKNSSAYLNSQLQRSTNDRMRKKYYNNERSRTNIGQRRFKHRATTSLNQLL